MRVLLPLLLACLLCAPVRADDTEAAREAARTAYAHFVKLQAELDAAIDERGKTERGSEEWNRLDPICEAAQEKRNAAADRFEEAFLRTDWRTWKPEGDEDLFRAGVGEVVGSFQSEETQRDALLRLAELFPDDELLAGHHQYGLITGLLWEGEFDAATEMAKALMPTMTDLNWAVRTTLKTVDVVAARGMVEDARKRIDGIAESMKGTTGIEEDVSAGLAVRRRLLGKPFPRIEGLRHVGKERELAVPGRRCVILVMSPTSHTWLRPFAKSLLDVPWAHCTIVWRFKKGEKLFREPIESEPEFKAFLKEWVVDYSYDTPNAWTTAESLAKVGLDVAHAFVVTDKKGRVVLAEGPDTIDSLMKTALRD